MSRLCPLFSSSKGNSIYISGGSTALLVDAGVSYKRLCNAMQARNLPMEDLQGILITHEHSDHIMGLEVLLKRLDIPVYASRETLEYLCASGKIPSGRTLVDCAGTFTIGDIEVTAFDTPHDAVHSLGFRFSMPDERVIGVATDLGHISGTVEHHLTGCDLILLESNYDQRMLEFGPYPYPLKRRIRSSTGHLSNDDCSETISRLIRSGSTYFVLGHLSEQNNLPEIAYQTSSQKLAEQSMRERLDYILHVAPAQGPGEVMAF
ncbi:MBL fold metallo-hydrolase [Ruminococcaceae bacterium OttesenSCG-928-L11]|nr:MBL fold metallo-hydrolase [Ruminococcaceae bacterium OttesenSCG-928-L11]